jgi:hypothetical protein
MVIMDFSLLKRLVNDASIHCVYRRDITTAPVSASCYSVALRDE